MPIQKYLSGLSAQNFNSLCDKINQKQGKRGTHYYDLLQKLIEEMADDQLPQTRLDPLANHLSAIIERMPSEVKKRGRIQNIFEQALSCHYQKACQFQEKIEDLKHLNRNLMITNLFMETLGSRPASFEEQSQRVQNQLGMLRRFTYLKGELNQAMSAEEVELARKNMKDFQAHLMQRVNPKLQVEIARCNSFGRRKFSTPNFVEENEKMRLRGEGHHIYPILSIDGGGIRGIIPARTLVEIENVTRRPISKLFNLIGGTSTGGILALGLTKPDANERPQYSAQDLLELYTDPRQRAQIFQKNPKWQEDTSHLKLHDKLAEAVFNPKYLDPSPVFNEKFGVSRLSSALTEVLITANSDSAVISKGINAFVSVASAALSFMSGIAGSPTPIWSPYEGSRNVHLFTKTGLQELSYSFDGLKLLRIKGPTAEIVGEYHPRTEIKHDFYMIDAARVTSAAPSFFPPVRIQSTFFMDGGVLQNNPAIPCALKAISDGHIREDLFMLSLGTGHCNYSKKPDLLSLWFETTQPSSGEDEAISNLLSPGAYHRLQYCFEDEPPKLDDISDDSVRRLEEAGKALVEENADDIREVCKVLRPRCI